MLAIMAAATSTVSHILVALNGRSPFIFPV